ncbi:hypothetical protein, partial [Streptomyces sp. SID5770]|uniref:hypothetical protein n=1 Tax=Streptomyces sp. SID5770 TaxID=2690308 RepID=UPI001F160E29
AGFTSWRDLLEVQHKLDRTADRIVSIGDVASYGSIVVSPRDRTLKVYWKGKQSDRLMKVIADIPDGLKAQIFPAKYSR